jgi:hypothetical protein
VVGDRYAASWTIDAFAKFGISYRHSDKDRSAVYSDVLPLFTSGRARLLDNQRLVGQLANLERRTTSSGRDKIDHPNGLHDDLANATSGALVRAAGHKEPLKIVMPFLASQPRIWPDSNPSDFSGFPGGNRLPFSNGGGVGR